MTKSSGKVAIFVKYIPATNTKPSRLKATANGNSITIPYSYDKSGCDLFATAAEALCKKMDWPGNLIGGELDNGYVFVFTE